MTFRSDICIESRLVQGIFEELHSSSFHIVKRKERNISGSGLMVYFFFQIIATQVKVTIFFKLSVFITIISCVYSDMSVQ